MYKIRKWVIYHSRLFERVYELVETVFIACDPIFRRIGYERIEKPVALFEYGVKSFLFDSQKCGICILNATGMVCPMNCPKQLRNGPCGGVRLNGNCEIDQNMRCVWVDAYEGIKRMKEPEKLTILQPSVDHRLKGKSAWLREVKIKVEDISKISRSPQGYSNN